MRLIFVAILSLLVSVSAVAKTDMVKASDHNRPILVKSSQPVVRVSLVSNRTTGYAWFLGSYDSNMVQPLTNEYKAQQSDIAGAPGESIWTFRIREQAFTVPQVIKITMIYGRPWDFSDVKTKVVTIITQ